MIFMGYVSFREGNPLILTSWHIQVGFSSPPSMQSWKMKVKVGSPTKNLIILVDNMADFFPYDYPVGISIS